MSLGVKIIRVFPAVNSDIYDHECPVKLSYGFPLALSHPVDLLVKEDLVPNFVKEFIPGAESLLTRILLRIFRCRYASFEGIKVQIII
jgi:hypothetical protein